MNEKTPKTCVFSGFVDFGYYFARKRVGFWSGIGICVEFYIVFSVRGV
jgi:hypothetical protein